MWEQIRENRRKSVFLFSGLLLVLAALGFFVGGAADPGQGPYAGLAVAFLTALVMGAVSYFSGDRIILGLAGATPVTHDLHPQLFNIVEEMRIAASLPAMPGIYIVPDMAPNAFATGRSPDKSSIVVTAGLLSRLNRDELQGVIAHEMSHIINRDVLYMTMAGVTLGAIIFLSEVYSRSMAMSRFAGGRRRGQGHLLFLLLAIVLAILAPILGQIFYFAVSRKREFLADASAARLTRYPEGLASALEKISMSVMEFAGGSAQPSRVIAPMYIVNPLHEQKAHVAGLFSTHPPTQTRIQVLRSMGSNAGYAAYQAAYESASGDRDALIPASELKSAQSVPVRGPGAAAEPARSFGTVRRDAGDLIRAVSRFSFLACACGLRMKIPPQFSRPAVTCPRCGRENAVPVAELAAAGAVLGSASGQGEDRTAAPPFIYSRRSQGWETFSCPCGSPVQISPLFQAPSIGCPKCGRKISVEKAVA
jgi:heat shock protein HtpX